MVNTKKLQGKMKENGFTLKSLADRIGLTPTGLFNKVHNLSEFNVSEVQRMASILALTSEERDAIFFAQNVDLESTKEV